VTLLVCDVELDILRVGDLVKHNVYGTGTIEKIEKSTITIRFATAALYAEHASWDDTVWMGLGIEFNVNVDSLSIRRNDHDEFLAG
jgi:hypothetical protein